MGEAKRLKAALKDMHEAAHKVGAAIRKLATAASGNLGGDCYLHAELGRALLADLGIEARRVVGYAAWRTGPGDSDVVAHVKQVPGFLPPGAQGFAYHAWLEVGCTIIDFSTHTLRHKAAELDALDGGSTAVAWCPDLLILRKRDVRSYVEVAKLHQGLAFYEEAPELESLLASQFTLDEGDLAAARLILSNPHINVMGPNFEAALKAALDRRLDEKRQAPPSAFMRTVTLTPSVQADLEESRNWRRTHPAKKTDIAELFTELTMHTRPYHAIPAIFRYVHKRAWHGPVSSRAGWRCAEQRLLARYAPPGLWPLIKRGIKKERL